MPPKPKFTKEEVAAAALELVKECGVSALTARELGMRLGTSASPIFTVFKSMDEVRAAIREKSLALYRERVSEGLQQPIPFLGVGLKHIQFAREDPELYRLLFLTPHPGEAGDAFTALGQAQSLTLPSIERLYHLDERAAGRYFRDMWLAVHGLATLIVTGCCPYTDQEISATLTGLSLSLCKALKEVPGFVEGTFDRDAQFRALVEK